MGKAIGKAIETDTDGSVYKGDLIDNERNGFAELQYKDLSTFTGFFKNGKKQYSAIVIIFFKN